MITASLLPLDSPCAPCLSKTKNIKDEISASPNQDFSPQATSNHLSTMKALQTTKITKLYFLSLLSLVFNRGFTISESKNKLIFSCTREKICLFLIWFFDLLPVRPLMYTHSSSPKTLYSLNQIPVMKPCSHFT